MTNKSNNLNHIKLIAKQMLISLQSVELDAWYEKKLQEAKTVFEVMSLLKKEYRLSFLNRVCDYISDEEFSINLVRAYVDTEIPDEDLDMSKGKLLEMFKKTNIEHTMTTEDKDILKSLGDKITVYRGVSDRKRDKIDYISWTYSYEQAEWFAKRYNEKSIVYKAEIDKQYIFALTNRRQESEIILDPNHLSNIQVFARFTPEVEESLTK